MRTALRAAGCAMAVIACASRERAPAQASTPFADSVSAAVSLLRSGMTLGAWIAAHPGDSIKLFDLPNLQPNFYSQRPFLFGDWCARAIRHGPITALAYFYPPMFAPGADLPPSQPDAHQRVRRAGCALGLVLLVSPESDSSRGKAAAADLLRSLQQRLGNAAVGAGGLSPAWTGTLAWQAGDLGFAVAFSRDSGAELQAEDEGGPETLVRYGDDQRGLVAVVYRLRPGGGIGDWEFGTLDEDDRQPEHPNAASPDSLFSARVEHPGGRCVRADSVIAQVGRYLATRPAPVMQARAHLVLARVYADRLLGPTPRNAAERAAEHYREALRLGRGTPLESVAWREGWRVSAGLLSVRLRFYCSSGD